MKAIKGETTGGGFQVHVTYLMGVLSLLFVLTLPSRAQNNPYKIDDDCYQYMRKINHVINKPIALKMCDTLRAMALSKHDLKAECISVNQRSVYYMQVKDLKLVTEFPRYKAFLEKTPYLQYLYGVWINLASLYELRKDFNMCLKTIQEMRADANRRNNNYGLASAYRKLGSAYHNLSDYQSALANYQKAYAILDAMHDKNIYLVEMHMGMCYDMLDNLDMAIKMMKQGLAHTPATYQGNSLVLYLNVMERNPEAFTVEEFEEVRKKIEQDSTYKALHSLSDNYNSTVCGYYGKRGMFDQALHYANKILNERTKVRAKLYIYDRTQKWDSAYVYSALNSTYLMEEWRDRNSELLAHSTASVDSSRLALNNKQMQINQLNEHRRMLEMQDKQNKLTIQKNLLTIKNGNLELANRNHAYLAQKQQMELQRSTSQINELKLQQELQKNRDLERQRIADSRRSLQLVGFLLFLLLIALYIVQITTKAKRRVLKEKEIALRAQADERQQKAIALNALNEAQVARQQAEEANNVKTMFLQNMSHEIRTPLNAIVGFSEVLTTPEVAESMDEDERSEMSRLIQVNSDLLLTLVNDILDVSKLQSGTYNLALSQVDASALCHDTLLSVQGREQAGVRLELRLPPTTVAFKTDKQRVQQVLINFLTNACKNTPTGRIILGYEPITLLDKSYLRFFVEDTGSGIPQDKKDAVFNRFEKLDDFKQGTGLGLNICRLITKLVHGNIYVDPSYTNGARFVFEHPI